MSLLDIDREAQQQRPSARGGNVPALDNIWDRLTPPERDILLKWLFSRGDSKGQRWQYSALDVAAMLTSGSYPISETTIKRARRLGWEPA